MKYKIVLTALLFFFISCKSLLYSQEFRDQLSNEKIFFVEIYSDKGNLIGNTNTDGLMSEDLKNKILSSDTKYLTFVNSFYQNKLVAIDDYKNNSTVTMLPITNELQEVVISDKKDKNQYLVIRTYVRSLQINNDRVQYFMDGIVDYYISLKTKKIKLKFISNRSFENKSIPQLKEKGFKIYFQIAGAPMLNKLLDYNNLNEGYNLQKEVTDIKINDKSDNSLRGYVSLDSNRASLSLGIITDDKPKVMKGLGVENILKNYTINALFSEKEFEKISFNSLLYFKEFRNYSIKAKKDIETQKVDAIHEAFVLEYRFSEKIDVKGLDNNYSFKNSSFHQSEYWKHIDNILLQPLPKSVEKFIEENLTEIKQ
ncbi:MAG: hypothetical protein EOO44_16930 [Flavobacterium sp.]|nr:MAG: hypothetical protein EOO44_16930 [Flavobacterium sp.]